MITMLVICAAVFGYLIGAGVVWGIFGERIRDADEDSVTHAIVTGFWPLTVIYYIGKGIFLKAFALGGWITSPRQKRPDIPKAKVVQR